MPDTTYTPSQMAAAILAIPGGTDTSDATAAADEILAGKTAYVNGVKIMGTATFAPTGTVIYYAGLSAPSGYLACDGTVYNISAYSELAAFFETNYGSKNYWGGNGSTTFAVPDWQGEFFRAAGTQSRENQGSGAAVGVHQDATAIPNTLGTTDGTSIRIIKASATSAVTVTNEDSQTSLISTATAANASYPTAVAVARGEKISTRPTNTSLLVCIKT